ncbi:MAG TPA: ParB/RepB/Spo0J family partition protein [Steroidobacteraceae bacterium]|nr:ParB/RepB/Spo0J family partition protein [Steroidobacteraceae bacterium]
MADKKRGLGRGLEALLGQAVPRPVADIATAARDQLTHVPVGLLERGRYQPRTDMREESLAELAESIRAQGVVQPIVVRPVGAPAPGEGQRYEIIAGERRWRAAQMVGLAELPAIVRRVDDETAVAMSLIENIQREDLNPLEEAMALSRLVTEFELTHQQAAEAVGRSRAAVSNLLRLLELPDEVKALVEQRQLEMGHARSLLALTNRRQLTEVGALVAKKGLSVRDTEALVRRLLARAAGGDTKHDAEDRDPDVRRLEEDLAEKLGAKVELRHGAAGKGRLVISYHSLDELDGILAHIR